MKTVSVATSVGASSAAANVGRQPTITEPTIHLKYLLFIKLSSYIASSPVSPVRTRTA